MSLASSSSSPSSPRGVFVHSNLQSFLHSVTPFVPSKTLPKGSIQDLNSLWHPADKDTIEYFTLQDLWGCYEEWSVYGAGAPMVLNDGDTVIQYYAPYLSAIQIYTTKSSANFRSPRESTGVRQSELQSWSEGSESDKLSRSSSNNSSKTWDATSVDSSIDHEGSSPVKDRLGYLYFQYYETSSPFWRIPLGDKVSEFAQTFPGLFTLKSVELSPASWMSIAWYPIYHIPMKGTVKDLATCFLTFHTLSSSFQGENDGNYTEGGITCSEGADEVSGVGCKEKSSDKISLPPFGLATYRMQGDVWLNGDPCDLEKMVDLYSAADSWLKQLGFWHHDFDFFTAHSTMSISLAK